MGDCYASGGRDSFGPVQDGTKQATHPAIKGTPRAPQPPGLKPKDLVGMPWRVAFALQADGWWLRSDIIWAKPNPMPESVTDRPTKAHEYIFLLAKSDRYFFDQEAVAEPCNWPEGSWGRSKCYDGDTTGKLRSFYGNGARWKGGETRNLRSVWTIATQPYPEAHFATFPEDLVKPCVLAGSRPGDIVMDPFAGSGTALYVAKEFGRRGIGIELKADYIDLAAKRMGQEVLPFDKTEALSLK
jgi:DNA modification methylase